ncbi:MAG: phosphoribosylformylglycinamidine cyclo-ligase [Thaumarchaeota archaeon]|nr:phosphoribosylformylglycinamidine cyclo-ligase [Nitrososphaerota archaeon]
MDKVGKIQRGVAYQLGATSAHRTGRVGAPLNPIGHYGGLVDVGGGRALALHTDGVGSKVLVAQAMKKFDTIGIDCVAVTVNDLICLGSEPISLVDYIALERENEELVVELGKGLVEGARRASVAIVGGETAILKDVVKGIGGNGFDLVSMGVGLVKKTEVVDGRAIESGDVVVGVASSGLHSNGFTLARRVLKRRPIDQYVPELGSSLGEALLAPTNIYVKPTLEALKAAEIHGIGHITGGSFSKLTRLAGGRKLLFDLRLPPAPPIFRVLQMEGGLTEDEMYRTFNMGIGLCLCLPERDEGKVIRRFERAGFRAFNVGRVAEGRGVRVNGVKLTR